MPKVNLSRNSSRFSMISGSMIWWFCVVDINAKNMCRSHATSPCYKFLLFESSRQTKNNFLKCIELYHLSEFFRDFPAFLCFFGFFSSVSPGFSGIFFSDFFFNFRQIFQRLFPGFYWFFFWIFSTVFSPIFCRFFYRIFFQHSQCCKMRLFLKSLSNSENL